MNCNKGCELDKIYCSIEGDPGIIKDLEIVGYKFLLTLDTAVGDLYKVENIIGEIFYVNENSKIFTIEGFKGEKKVLEIYETFKCEGFGEFTKALVEGVEQNGFSGIRYFNEFGDMLRIGLKKIDNEICQILGIDETGLIVKKVNGKIVTTNKFHKIRKQETEDIE